MSLEASKLLARCDIESSQVFVCAARCDSCTVRGKTGTVDDIIMGRISVPDMATREADVAARQKAEGELADDYAEGDVVTVDFDLRGREWNGKYFTNLQAWRMTRGEQADDNGDSGQMNQVAPDFDEDIPF